jgi:hypothetical protein
MADVYTIRFWGGGVVVGTNSPTVQAPTGYSWIITDVCASQTYASGALINLVDSVIHEQIIELSPVSGNNFMHWTGRQALPAGTGFWVAAAVNQAYVFVTGYQLASP